MKRYEYRKDKGVADYPILALIAGQHGVIEYVEMRSQHADVVWIKGIATNLRDSPRFDELPACLELMQVGQLHEAASILRCPVDELIELQGLEIKVASEDRMYRSFLGVIGKPNR